MTKRILYSALSGFILIFAFPPFKAGFLAFIALVPFLYQLRGADKKQGFVFGFIFGFAFFIGTVNWVIHSMYYYGGVPMPLSILAMVLLVAAMSVYTGLFGLLASMASKISPFWRLILIPSLWVTAEYMRGYLFTGFPWVLLGYTQGWHLPMIQMADITGVWGVSFLVVFINTAITLWAGSYLNKDASFGGKRLAAALGILVPVIAYGVFRMNAVDGASASWESLKVGIAQGSIDQAVKWDSAYKDETLSIYKELSVKAADGGARLIVWPETAVPFYMGGDGKEFKAVEDIARQSGSYILTGSPSYNYNLLSGSVDYYNSAYLLSPANGVIGKYDKIHLVPFGEYVPLRQFLPFIKKLTAGIGDFSTGAGPLPISFDGGGIGVLVCYESIFPDIARGEVKNGASLLVNITNDGWFGTTSAPYQHFGMAVFRAVENRTYLLRSANTGISAVIDPVGRVVRETELFKRDVFTADARLRQGKLSLYSAYGDVFAISCVIISIIFLLRRNTRRYLDV